MTGPASETASLHHAGIDRLIRRPNPSAAAPPAALVLLHRGRQSRDVRVSRGLRDCTVIEITS